MKFTGPRVARNNQELIQNQVEDSRNLDLIIEALDAAEEALYDYAEDFGELFQGKRAIRLIQEVRDKL